MGQLSELQSRVLVALAGMDPPWTLSGGGALVGFHLGHRTTRDLDLFWRGRRTISDVRGEVRARLESAGFQVSELRSQDAFSALKVAAGDEIVVVDLVAEPVASIEAAESLEFRGVTILVDTPHEVLVNKLCTLLHRSELRDLVDIQSLLDKGGDLSRALQDAPRKDGGFSALTLGWSIQSWPVEEAAKAAGMPQRAAELVRFRDELLALVAGNRPDDSHR